MTRNAAAKLKRIVLAPIHAGHEEQRTICEAEMLDAVYEETLAPTNRLQPSDEPLLDASTI